MMIDDICMRQVAEDLVEYAAGAVYDTIRWYCAFGKMPVQLMTTRAIMEEICALCLHAYGENDTVNIYMTHVYSDGAIREFVVKVNNDVVVSAVDGMGLSAEQNALNLLRDKWLVKEKDES